MEKIPYYNGEPEIDDSWHWSSPKRDLGASDMIEHHEIADCLITDLGLRTTRSDLLRAVGLRESRRSPFLREHF